MKLLLGLGSNLGDRAQNLAAARTAIGEFAPILRESTVIETEPWGYSSANNYLNQVIVCECSLDPETLLEKTQQVERNLGRTCKTENQKYEDRPIDIDILTYGNLNISTPNLTIPHPRIAEREFIVKSLRELGEF